LKKGSIVTLEMEKFADRGKSLTRLDGYVVFVAGSVPGDTIKARVFKKRKKFAEAALLEVITPSPLRTEPKCSYFLTCGGCKWQHVQYDSQLEAKQQSVQDAFEHHGGFESVEVKKTIGAENTYYYRNKMEFSFSAGRWLTPTEIASGEDFDTSFALGLHVPGNYAKVLDLKECYLQSELSTNLVNAVRDLALEHEWKPWDTRRHVGYLRHLVIRQSAKMPEMMVNLVTSYVDTERTELFAEFLKSKFPQVTTLVNTINSGVAQTAFGEEAHVIFGPGVVHDKIGDCTFEIASNAFFQTNTFQAQTLYEVALEFAELKPTDLVYDLYCGAGTISCFVAPHVKHVVGVELIEEAVQNARKNAKANGISNVSFITGDMMRLFNASFVKKHGRPDVLIVDPPRAGLHPKVVEQIKELAPDRFVYVSCNPMTQARDLALLADTYDVDVVQPVDLFPHTHHIESVARLRKK
jgi:23S rRNA (uracil1939-C5)-methyltransferase